MAKQYNTVDVLVIGAGASGGAFTWSLTEAGFQVLCLEQGGWLNPQHYPAMKEGWEFTRYGDYATNPNVRRLPEDYPVNDADSPISPLMFNAVGGSTIHWGGQFPRLRPSDFRVRTLDGVADDWPMSYKDLEPFYDLNDKMVGVAGVAGDPAYPIKPARPLPPIPLGKMGDTIVRGLDKLGWHWWPSDAAILTRDYDGRGACNNCGPCDIGCAVKAKASSDVTYWPKAIAKGAQLKTYARVREITVNKQGLADGAIYYDRDGRLHHQKAKIVVVAANGIGTPRLLLNSKSALSPDGLANSGGMVGKNLMFHPYAMAMGVFEEDLESYIGPNSCTVFCQEFYETDLSRGFVRSHSFQIGRGAGPLMTAMGNQGRFRVPWGQDHHRVLKERLGHTINIAVCGEDLPEHHNQVTIDPVLTDGDGIPAPKITYKLSENSRKMMDHGIDRAKELLDAAGAKQIFVNPLARVSGWHLMGTARMGTHAGNSVVDGHGRAHDVKNLFVIDGSAFVTSGAVNPCSTVQALALYFADHFKRSHRHLLD
ncbi:MAG: GMC family oxidoreductase [SAR202 cluster bacterium]|nr:GMC family oxidoreductase [SAR202 cluster bacterium]